ncbi:uncharacterized protein LOC131162868 [Malania oleifera]|uniref:uncharacterized protein LOC131162868 n=1 Tax=Malania oleifera TaxID=397392 RepID=UPI0025ADCCF5|nr:uncharacterized protein LOC131162868 [Malania oleifera]
MDQIKNELRGNLMQSQQIDEVDDVDDIAYPPDISSYERSAYRQAFYASKQTEWERDQSRRFAAYFLNAKCQYKEGVGEDPYFLDAVHKVFNTLEPHSSGLDQIGNEIIIFRDAKRSFGEAAAKAARATMAPADWWMMYGSSAPILRKLALRILSQTASSSACERNWSTFALIHTKQRNRLAYSRLQQLVFCYYNMKLRIRDMEAEMDKVAEQDPLDLLDISVELGDEDEYPLFQWIRPSHLDERDGSPHPQMAKHAQDDFGIDVNQVMVEEVISSSDDSQMNLGSRYGTSSMPSGGDDDNDDDDAGGDGSNLRDSSGQGGDGGDYGGNEGWQDYRPEVEYTRPSQLEDEGPQRETRPVDRQYSRRKGKGKMQSVGYLTSNFPLRLCKALEFGVKCTVRFLSMVLAGFENQNMYEETSHNGVHVTPHQEAPTVLDVNHWAFN